MNASQHLGGVLPWVHAAFEDVISSLELDVDSLDWPPAYPDAVFDPSGQPLVVPTGTDVWVIGDAREISAVLRLPDGTEVSLRRLRDERTLYMSQPPEGEATLVIAGTWPAGSASFELDLIFDS